MAVVCGLPLAGWSQTAWGQEWPRFRGPNGTGVGKGPGIPSEWKASEVNWRVKLPGAGHSSPVLWGKRIFLTGANLETGSRLVFCLDADDGKLLWEKEYAARTHPVHVQNSFASSTPCCDAERVYVAWATPEEFALVALDHEGNEQWRRNLGKFESEHGFGTSPMLHEGMVILSNHQDGESSVLAVDAKSGEDRWRLPRRTRPKQSTSYATPFVYAAGGMAPQLIVDSWAHGMTSVDPATGVVNWELGGIFERRPVGSPIVAAGLLIGNCGEGSGNNTVIAVRLGEKGNAGPTVAYKLDRSTASYVPSLLADGGLWFSGGDRGGVSCVDAATGEVKWTERIGGNYSSSPVRVDDRLFGISSDGEVVVLAAADKFKLLGRTALGEDCRATPAVAHGRMYLRTVSHLISIGGP